MGVQEFLFYLAMSLACYLWQPWAPGGEGRQVAHLTLQPVSLRIEGKEKVFEKFPENPKGHDEGPSGQPARSKDTRVRESWVHESRVHESWAHESRLHEPRVMGLGFTIHRWPVAEEPKDQHFLVAAGHIGSSSGRSWTPKTITLLQSCGHKFVYGRGKNRTGDPRGQPGGGPCATRPAKRQAS